MTKLDRINEILAVARKAIDEYERKALKGDATWPDAMQTMLVIVRSIREVEVVATYVEPKAGEVAEVLRPNVTITVNP